MNWFENKTTQIIALVGIVTTLAGFGYTGATYVNRVENLEAKIGGIGDTKKAQNLIEERFVAIETSVAYINKTIDKTILVEIKAQGGKIEEIKTDIATIKAEISSIEQKIAENNKNPLSG
jgi:peptidoglycan hydrolase CwlO-like protein|tara:strand:+ start:167 stop:526 length:360 start_codon:yes stop_codon:yes gene_type:complete